VDGRVDEIGFCVVIVRIIIAERSLAPAAQVIVEIRSHADSAALPIVQVDFPLQFVVQIPIVTAEDERPE